MCTILLNKNMSRFKEAFNAWNMKGRLPYALIFANFEKKSTLRSKNEETNLKKPKVKKKWEICAHLNNWNALLDSQKHCGINFRASHINVASIDNIFYKKN